jgi:alpha-ketoglutarate-dependent taurine dioxygenase
MNDFPLIIDGSDKTEEWFGKNLPEIEQQLNKHGALLFRNFPLESRNHLERILKTLVPVQSVLDYKGGTSPREKMGEGIYSSTKMPFFLKIPLHSEMAYRKRFPKKILFFCETAPLWRGETPIVDIRKVYQDVPIEIRNKLESEGIIYYRHLKNFTRSRKILTKLNPMIEMGTWQFVFKTSSPADVDLYAAENHYETKWLPDGSVILKTTLPATLTKGSWFNSFHFFQVHHRIWGWMNTIAYTIFSKLSRSPDMSATTGKLQRLSSDEISKIVDAYEKNMTSFRWQKGDLLYLDNTVTAHGRSPYLGKRKILVSLAEEGEFPSL